MIAVIKGDIIASRKIQDPEVWMNPLKELLSRWGDSPKDWELVWGDFFQLEIKEPITAFGKALAIKALIKNVVHNKEDKSNGLLDVRLAIGIGAKTYAGTRISESNGPAFIHAGERFEKLKKDKINLAIQSPWEEFDKEMNLYLKLAGTFMDSWTVSSAELVAIYLDNPKATQEEIGEKLGIRQNSVSGRWSRAKVDELIEINKVFQHKLNNLLQ
ncbi:MAG: hypothetical protein EA341_09250 [Mongoliibacter sp.]|uniref:hypothetical protein n=1 Tax=Mongoliibacter sp. TaxID=2022438 RepID=UPI0012EF62C0|nr:hypothetical protein [Mongoliibacter sp.]TVP49413.1 MAG: hypothetical protein EA341_09250 [Mongoliibacter sp.]